MQRPSQSRDTLRRLAVITTLSTSSATNALCAAIDQAVCAPQRKIEDAQRLASMGNNTNRESKEPRHNKADAPDDRLPHQMVGKQARQRRSICNRRHLHKRCMADGESLGARNAH